MLSRVPTRSVVSSVSFSGTSLNLSKTTARFYQGDEGFNLEEAEKAAQHGDLQAQGICAVHYFKNAGLGWVIPELVNGLYHRLSQELHFLPQGSLFTTQFPTQAQQKAYYWIFRFAAQPGEESITDQNLVDIKRRLELVLSPQACEAIKQRALRDHANPSETFRR